MITCAALRIGEVTLSKEPPARHHDLLEELDRITQGEHPSLPVEQGFLTDEGQFVDRKAAMKIAVHNEQRFLRKPHSAELFSEDLW